MPRKKKSKKADEKEILPLLEEVNPDDIIEFKYVPRQITKYIKDERGIVTKYVFKRWTYGEELDAMTRASKKRKGELGTELDMKEYTLLMIEGTVKEPKLTRQKILDLDPQIGKELFKWCMYLNSPETDFQTILAKLEESP